MGIPFYFRYLIRTHPAMLQKQIPALVSTLYIDSNSIIYDCFHAMTADPAIPFSEAALIQRVCEKIRHYLLYVRPQHTVLVAFDGVAPLAKMDQQRTRRNKHLFDPCTRTTESKPSVWNTNAITPGTQFMLDLATALENQFALWRAENAFPGVELLLSTAANPGEGEHKLFAHLRCKPPTGGDVVVYGLDADLIMLSLLHLRYTGEGNKLWIFREAPHFDKGKDKGKKEDKKKDDNHDCLHLDVGMLSRCLLKDMGSSDYERESFRRIDDYVFLCFFLGNDFLPHFPCMNIRTHGMPALLDMYQDVCRQGEYMVDAATGTVNWPVLQRWINKCASMEVEWFRKEKDTRDKMASTMWRGISLKDPTEVVDQVPLLFRGEEAYIDAGFTRGWEQRYYKVLFHGDLQIPNPCRDFLRGLEWVWLYYTRGCDDWRWRYPWSYPPLMADLARHFSETVPASPTGRDMGGSGPVHRGASGPVHRGASGPVHPHVQLAYVLPPENRHLIPCQAFVDRLPSGLDEEKPRFAWSYARFFWEAHVELPELSIESIEACLKA
jgi:5'-3' exonuclease